ncbi:MAG: cytochrome c3 family protein [Limisphaerales bacterium]
MTIHLYQRLRGTDRSLFLPGATSHGHFQIELACAACHTPLMGVREDACNQCHGAELKAAKDSHPRSKFTDPRNADLLRSIDASRCVTCHREHVPEQTRSMGVTLPNDFCFHCHKSTVEDRPSHRGLPFATCSTAGCHNFHDNTALYEDFLARHRDEPDLNPTPRVPTRHDKSHTGPAGNRALTAADMNGPADTPPDSNLVGEWAASSHARVGINCRDCHGVGGSNLRSDDWSDAVPWTVCQGCHTAESEGFLGGHHGMRLAQGLSPMSPAMARLPMRPESTRRELTCSSCHGAHGFDTRTAAMKACLDCHADTHSKNFAGSPHAELWLAEGDGAVPAGSGVSCATCHMPRDEIADEGGKRVATQHNQNLNLRPNEKMLRNVCLSCHGLGFAMDALADPDLIRSNFRGQPSRHVESIDWVKRRLRAEDPTPNRN